MLKLDAVKHSGKKDFTKYAKQLYHANKAKYKVEERIDAAHILVSHHKSTEAKALAKAKKIREELLSGVDLAALALRDSDDKSVKKNKGQLGKFTEKQLVKEFTEVAFAMKPGDISEPVKTSFGYHIIKLNKKIPAGYLSFEEAKNQIINELKEKDWEVRRSNYYEQIKKNNQMEIDDKALDEYVAKKLEELDNL
jgi:peptidyl-prolyl cis-trans isomerase C